MWDDPDRLRSKLAKLEEAETSWRIEPFGWDEKERMYFVLDDNRLYRQTPKPLPPPPEPKSKSKAKGKGKPKKAKPAPKPVKRGTRRSLRGKQESEDEPEAEESEVAEDEPADEPLNGDTADDTIGDDGLGGDKWECLAVTLTEYEDILRRMGGSRDYNQKQLHKRITQHVLPIIQEGEDLRARKIAKRQRELLTLEKLATAKRSSRLAGKADREREEQLAREAEEKHRRELAAAQKDAERQKQMEHDRQSRMITREQRLRERDYKRILHEEELRRLEEEKEKLESGDVDAKKSERQLKSELKRKQDALKELETAEDEWMFDCAQCGQFGKNWDDGKHSIACETCNVWQHSACLGLTEDQADSKSFTFICNDCKRKEEDAKKPKIAPLRFPAGLSSPSQFKTVDATPKIGSIQNGVQVATDRPAHQQKRKSTEADGTTGMPPLKKFKPVKHSQATQPLPQVNGGAMHTTFLNGPTLSPQGQVQSPVNGTRPPGLVSPQRPTHSTVNYTPSQPMQFGPALQSSSPQQQGLANGHSPQKQNHAPRTPASNDPFRNTFVSQAPGSAKSQASPSQGPVLQTQGSQQMLPPQTTPTSSFQSNGNGSFQYIPPTTPSVAQKQQVAAPSPAPSTTLQASSPAMAPPHRPDAVNAGISPVKNSPPRPTSRDIQMSPVAPTAPKLVPSPEQAGKPVTGGESPVKSAMPPSAPATTG